MQWNIIQKKENRPGTDRGLDIKIYIPTSKLFSFVQTMKNEWSTNYLMLKFVVILPDDQSSNLLRTVMINEETLYTGNFSPLNSLIGEEIFQ